MFGYPSEKGPKLPKSSPKQLFVSIPVMFVSIPVMFVSIPDSLQLRAMNEGSFFLVVGCVAWLCCLWVDVRAAVNYFFVCAHELRCVIFEGRFFRGDFGGHLGQFFQGRF